MVAAAWLFTLEEGERQWRGMAVGFGLWLIVGLLLLSQPDFGQFALITLVWGFQLFLAGLPHLWIGLLILLGLASLAGDAHEGPTARGGATAGHRGPWERLGRWRSLPTDQ